MRFLLDESVDARIRPCLRAQGHEFTRIANDYPAGLPDDEVLALAYSERRILLASDRDFGALVFVEHQPHAGVVLFRLAASVTLETTVALLDVVLTRHVHELDQVIVVTRQTDPGPPVGNVVA